MKPRATSYWVRSPALFWSKVDKSGPCWLWTAYRTSAGYGMVKVDGHATPAHRVAYFLVNGEIPEGLGLDHLCRNRPCVNPDHLEPTTWRENIHRGDGVAGRHARQTACKRGHAFNEANTYRFGPDNRHRACRCCRALNESRKRIKKAA